MASLRFLPASQIPLAAAVLVLLATAIGHAANGPKAVVASPKSEDDQVKQFISVVLAETEDYWGISFKANGLKYEEPKLVLFTGNIHSACGPVSGTTYCNTDHKIYLDPNSPEFQKAAAIGDFAEAIVVARQVAHHVQNILSVRFPIDAQSLEIEREVDCFAGLWTRYVQDKGLLEDDDLTEARQYLRHLGEQSAGNAAADLMSGSVGTPEDRLLWYERGIAGIGITSCNASDYPP
ncbi:MAG: hypothetical protein E5X72_01705 [Mesorhizobium sp.]|uniref:neutral zinc metallopeptidase n=1 Tax=Mesorhizobium sp. TaxID=1871066 RepID=UPI00120816BF|nr:neutral zinc metallopeptidase [Mesorhizobium sp.]TIP06458.1 MAG: hypothetical protein E5X72_01705 [Mesorhizobium sp.]